MSLQRGAARMLSPDGRCKTMDASAGRYKGVLHQGVTTGCYNGVLHRGVTPGCYTRVLHPGVTCGHILGVKNPIDIFYYPVRSSYQSSICLNGYLTKCCRAKQSKTKGCYMCIIMPCVWESRLALSYLPPGIVGCVPRCVLTVSV